MYKILLFLGFLIFILFSTKQGFEPFLSSSIGKYDYLQPIPTTNTWNQEIKTKFINRYNSNLGNGNDDKMLKPDDPLSGIISFSLEEEGVYYNNHGKFPINLYVQDYLNANPDKFPNQTSGSLKMNSTTISQFVPNRLLYAAFIAPYDSKLNPPPEAYNIYLGKKPAVSSSSSSLSPSDVQTLKSICSKY